MKYVMTEYRNRENTAINKAPEDVVRVVESLGFRQLIVKSHKPRSTKFLDRVISKILWSIEKVAILKKFSAGDVFLIQETPGFLCRQSGKDLFAKLKQKGVKIIFLIHDIGELREQDRGMAIVSKMLFDTTTSFSDVIIAHNDRMAKWLVEHGIAQEKIVLLHIFDYLMTERLPCTKHYGDDIVIAGSMSAVKSKYLASLKNITNVSWKLYGPHFDRRTIMGDEECSCVEYCGSYDPEGLPTKLNGSFGLVWDGDAIETCAGATGNYLRYNNPHKLSLFIACGFPVIIWNEAAEADFVISNGVGLTVHSLREIPDKLKAVSEAEYNEMATNALEIGRRMREGAYTREAIEKALEGMSCK